MTLTIQLPRDLAAQISALPEAERQAFAVAALREATAPRAAAAAATAEYGPPTDEDHQAIAEALSDMDEGRAQTRPASEFFDEMARKHGFAAS